MGAPALPAESWTTNDDATRLDLQDPPGREVGGFPPAPSRGAHRQRLVTAAAYVLDAAHQSGTAASYFGVVKNAGGLFQLYLPPHYQRERR